MTRQNVLDNYSHWRPGNRRGMYESYFLRGNSPDEPRAFWIKFTVFAPKGKPEEAEGELWAIYFEDQEGSKVAVKEAYPMNYCIFAPDRFLVRVGEGKLADGTCTGSCSSGAHSIEWDLGFPVDMPSLHFLPEWAYQSSFPKAKGLAPYPDVTWEGSLKVDGQVIDVTGWKGSQNHNWGEKHTDQYYWAQCSSFVDRPDTYMEMMTARIKLGPVWTPPLSFLALNYRGQAITFNSPSSLLKANAHFPNRFEWRLSLDNGSYQADCKVSAKKETFAGLRYRNPPGGEHACLNSKIASSEIRLRQHGKDIDRLRSEFTTAFEVLTDEPDHGVPLLI